MKINNKKVVGEKFAYDGCHKIYIIENAEQEKEAAKTRYEIYDISLIKEKFDRSCELRFISNWGFDKQYVKQYEEAIFEM